MVCPQAHVFTLFSACTYQIPGTLTGLACAVLWSSLPQSQAADKWPLPLSPDPEGSVQINLPDPRTWVQTGPATAQAALAVAALASPTLKVAQGKKCGLACSLGSQG